MKDLYFSSPRLEMSSATRVLVRLVIYSAYGVLIAAAVSFSLSDVAIVKSAGWIMILFLLDRWLHLGKADYYLDGLSTDGLMNLGRYLSPAAFNVLEYAFEKSLWSGGDLLLYLGSRLLSRREIKTALRRLDINPDEFEAKLDEYLKNSLNQKNDKAALLSQAESLIKAACQRAISLQELQIEPKNLFSALSDIDGGTISKLFTLFDISKGDLENALIFAHFEKKLISLGRLPATLTGLTGKSFKIRHRIMNRAWTARPTPFLDKYAIDLTDMARAEKVGFLIGHDQPYDQMVDVLSRPGNPNALLVGEPGVGKGALVANLAYRIIKDRVPAALFDKRLVSLDIGSLVAGAAEGDLQDRVKKIVDEIAGAGNIILYIPDIHNLVKTSGQMHLSAADILLPAIKSTAFSVIGATYPREFKQYIESNNDFISAFEIIRIQEITEDEAIKFLVYDSVILERQYKMVISFAAVKQAVKLAHKYFRQKLLPASAEDLLREALADTYDKGKNILGAEDVIDIAQRKINIPLRGAAKSDAEKLLNLEQLIHQRLVDQEEAVKAVARALREYRAGLSRPGGTIANFLFVGPTGVGKTELAKILSKIHFGSAEAMIRFDMSEYQTKESLYRFIGSPDGTTSGALTDAVLQKPYSLILLDEMEKAHPDILNLFLQVFDDGRLTDNLGRTIDFQHVMIIATSNAESNFIKSGIEAGRSIKEIAEELKKRLTASFRPELLNRFSDIIVFRNLLPEHLKAIVKIQLQDLAATAAEQGIVLSFDESVAAKIAELGYDPVFGARPLRKVVSEKLRSELAEKILREELGRGSNVKIIYDKEFKFIKN